MLITAYDRQTCCWRYKQRGHNRFNCKNEANKFCSRCGRDDVLSRDCKCASAGKRQQGRTERQQDPAPEPTENRYFITVKVGALIAEALIDPGVATSFVNPEMARQGINIGWQEANEE